MTGDGVVDLADFFAYFNCWDRSRPCADLDNDGAGDLFDMFAFLHAMDTGCGG